MLFWVVAVALTLCASLAVLLPLSGRSQPAASSSDHDLEVYRDQLAEVERDVARGVVPQAEAEQARAEIGRRILRLSASDGRSGDPSSSARQGRLVAMAAVLAVPLVAWGVYSDLGSPDLPSQPLAERLARNPADSSVDELVARAEAHLAANPDDGRGWDVLAPVYVRMQRYSDAVTAYRNAIRLSGATAARQSGLGEALAYAASGIVTADAQAAFDAARVLDPADPKAGFYLGIAMAQEGRKAEARSSWQGMLDRLPQDSPWRVAATEALAELAKGSAPSQQTSEPMDDAAAASMTPEDRAAMIETMVAGLDDRLRHNPRDADGWMKLIRSYVVLGRTGQAHDALQRGQAAFGPESEQAKQLTAFAASLGLSATE